MLEIHILMQLLDKHGAWAHDYYREDYGWWGHTDKHENLTFFLEDICATERVLNEPV